MAGRVERFEDLIAWQRARRLTHAVYAATSRGGFAGDFGLRNQIQRAAVSIVANIAEGFERTSRAEFHQHRSIAQASCAETRALLYIALDCGYLNQSQFDQLMSDAIEVGRIVGGLRAAVDRQRNLSNPSTPHTH